MVYIFPKWDMTDTLPAFHDSESATAIEMVYKLYETINKLIEEHNSFIEHVNEILTNNEIKFNHDLEIYATGLRQEFQDFIDTVDLKITEIEGG